METHIKTQTETDNTTIKTYDVTKVGVEKQ